MSCLVAVVTAEERCHFRYETEEDAYAIYCYCVIPTNVDELRLLNDDALKL